MMRNSIILLVLSVILVLMVINVRYCERKHVPEVGNKVLHDTIEVITQFRDTAKIEVVKWKTVLKQGRDRIIHDTLKCDSVFVLATKQDTLIRIDSILITKYIELSNNNTKTIDSLTKDKKGRWHAFKQGFGTGYVLGLGTALILK